MKLANYDSLRIMSMLSSFPCTLMPYPHVATLDAAGHTRANLGRVDVDVYKKSTPAEPPISGVTSMFKIGFYGVVVSTPDFEDMRSFEGSAFETDCTQKLPATPVRWVSRLPDHRQDRFECRIIG